MRCTNTLTHKGYTGSVEIKNGKLCGKVLNSKDSITYYAYNLEGLKKAFEREIDTKFKNS